MAGEPLSSDKTTLSDISRARRARRFWPQNADKLTERLAGLGPQQRQPHPARRGS